MKQVYSKIKPTTGLQVAGICSVKIIPREWLAGSVIIDFNTGAVLNEPTLKTGKAWIEFQFTDDSYDWDEKLKSSKSGSYFESSISGTLNDLTASSLQVLETLRYHELVVIVKDRKKRARIVGDMDAGAIMQYSSKQNNNQAGTHIVSINMMMQHEAAAPFYDVDGTDNYYVLGDDNIILAVDDSGTMLSVI